jgi:nicotinate-nucleotide adenylyltransferase
MRVGAFGGTFDPVHLGHLIVAEQCREQARLDQVLFVPAARPPHKLEQELTAFARRVEMMELAIAGHPHFAVADIEKDRPGPSYTADTLAELQRRYPDAELFLVIGSDCIGDLQNWHNPRGIGDLAELLIVARPGWGVDASSLPPALGRRQIVTAPLIDISSRDLRRRAAEGRSLRYLVPPAVDCYIGTHRLYRPG